MISFLDILKSKNEPMYYCGWVCLLGAIICYILTKTTQTQVLGTNAWFKPFKFLLSTTIFVWSMGWYLQYLDDTPSVMWYSWGMILLLNFENVYIIYQASQGEMSHFNLTTPFKAAMFSLMRFKKPLCNLQRVYVSCIESKRFKKTRRQNNKHLTISLIIKRFCILSKEHISLPFQKPF